MKLNNNIKRSIIKTSKSILSYNKSLLNDNKTYITFKLHTLN